MYTLILLLIHVYLVLVELYLLLHYVVVLMVGFVGLLSFLCWLGFWERLLFEFWLGLGLGVGLG